MASKKNDRELIDTGTDKRFVRRDAGGQFEVVVDVGKSLAQDRRTKAKRTVKSGEGDRGDQKPRARTTKGKTTGRTKAKPSRARSTKGSAARVIRRERGWRRSVPWSVTTCGAPRSASAGQAVSPKCAWTTSKAAACFASRP